VLVPGSAGGEIDRLRIRGPGEGVNFFLAERNGKRLAAVGRNEIDLGSGLVRGGFAVVVVTPILSACKSALRKKGDPAAVRGPERSRVLPRLGEARERAVRGVAPVAVEPEIGLEDLTIPVCALGGDDDRVSVGGDLDSGNFDVVEKL